MGRATCTTSSHSINELNKFNILKTEKREKQRQATLKLKRYTFCTSREISRNLHVTTKFVS